MTAVADPIRMLETLLALGVQLLLAAHPELLLPPEVAILRPSRRLRLARDVAALLRETHYALQRYGDEGADPREALDDARTEGEDAFPF